MGIRSSIIPEALVRSPRALVSVTKNVGKAIGREGRKDMRRELRAMSIAALRAFRSVLDRTAELTVELELRARQD
jgi:hypothetical protein